MIEKDFILEKAKYESGIDKDITVGDVLKQDGISFNSGISGASVCYFVNPERTAIVRRVINYETGGEPSVSYKEVYYL